MHLICQDSYSNMTAIRLITSIALSLNNHGYDVNTLLQPLWKHYQIRSIPVATTKTTNPSQNLYAKNIYDSPVTLCHCHHRTGHGPVLTIIVQNSDHSRGRGNVHQGVVCCHGDGELLLPLHPRIISHTHIDTVRQNIICEGKLHRRQTCEIIGGCKK